MRATRLLLGLLLVSALLHVRPAQAETSLGMGDCSWGLKADPDRVNVAYPDEGAQYWLTRFTAVPGVTLKIAGRFPRARYFSFHVYEGSIPVDALADVEIAPAAGSNPFFAGADRRRSGTYEVQVVPGSRPKGGPRNTLYSPGLNGEPNVAGVIIYRVYLPEGDIRGGVPLPTVTISTDGDRGHNDVPLPSCQDTLPQGGGTANEAVREMSSPLPSAEMSAPPQWGLARSKPQPTSVGPATVYTGNPFFPNFHNQYLSLRVVRAAAEVVAFRAKAPSFPRTRKPVSAPTMGSGQLRYWSVCANDFPTTRYVACLADDQIKIDRTGHFTIVVSDVDHRPSKLRSTDNWLPNGPYGDFFVLYRHMLPHPLFSYAIHRAPDAAGALKSMGAYYPSTRLCSRARFEQDRCGL